ncbi:hypothetical protein R3X25_12520 [Lutibacter sp. TH_r2]|uniref:hypothetical protein n=1 Tax=Lutibacter sp. TH_r2 TaxID=3082083 RepID=UPI002952B6AA|nr:hypothetical protein [Lutibacter sp. TH_r2]MDV7188108.1 hypothetical protein [Lutibacter sp. TH_r2]
MNPIVRNVLAVVAGLFLGGIVNMGIVMVSSSVIPLPEGVDPSSMQSLKESMHLFEPKNFLMPFLAHALGTLFGAFIASLIAKTYKLKLALAVGVFFLIGGIMNVVMLPSPTWFAILDIVGAYIPMAFLGFKLSKLFQ